MRACAPMQIHACILPNAHFPCLYVCVCFSLELRLLFVEWSSGAHSDRWCELLIAVFSIAGVWRALSSPVFFLCLFHSPFNRNLSQTSNSFFLLGCSPFRPSSLFFLSWSKITVVQFRSRCKKRYCNLKSWRMSKNFRFLCKCGP